MTKADALLSLATTPRPVYERAVLVTLVGHGEAVEGGFIWRGRVGDLAALAAVSVRKMQGTLGALVEAGTVTRTRVEGGIEVVVGAAGGSHETPHDVPNGVHDVPIVPHGVPNGVHTVPNGVHDVPFFAGARACVGVTSPSYTTYTQDPSLPLPPSAKQPDPPASAQVGGVETPSASEINARLSAALEGIGEVGELARIEADMARVMGVMSLNARDSARLSRLVDAHGIAAVVECAPDAIERGNAPVPYLASMLKSGGKAKRKTATRPAPGAQVNARWGADEIAAVRAAAEARNAGGNGRTE